MEKRNKKIKTKKKKQDTHPKKLNIIRKISTKCYMNHFSDYLDNFAKKDENNRKITNRQVQEIQKMYRSIHNNLKQPKIAPVTFDPHFNVRTSIKPIQIEKFIQENTKLEYVMDIDIDNVIPDGKDGLSSFESMESFVCDICCSLYANPMKTICNHNFCKICLDAYFNNKKIAMCPICSQIISKSTCVFNEPLNIQIFSLTIKCKLCYKLHTIGNSCVRKCNKPCCSKNNTFINYGVQEIKYHYQYLCCGDGIINECDICNQLYPRFLFKNHEFDCKIKFIFKKGFKIAIEYVNESKEIGEYMFNDNVAYINIYLTFKNSYMTHIF
jgi:hypothetical protein